MAKEGGEEGLKVVSDAWVKRMCDAWVKRMCRWVEVRGSK